MQPLYYYQYFSNMLLPVCCLEVLGQKFWQPIKTFWLVFWEESWLAGTATEPSGKYELDVTSAIIMSLGSMKESVVGHTWILAKVVRMSLSSQMWVSSDMTAVEAVRISRFRDTSLDSIKHNTIRSQGMDPDLLVLNSLLKLLWLPVKYWYTQVTGWYYAW